MTNRCDTIVLFLTPVFACLLVSLSAAQVRGSETTPSPAGKRDTQIRSTFPLTKFYDPPSRFRAGTLGS